jgi:N utilization substance protein B
MAERSLETSVRRQGREAAMRLLYAFDTLSRLEAAKRLGRSLAVDGESLIGSRVVEPIESDLRNAEMAMKRQVVQLLNASGRLGADEGLPREAMTFARDIYDGVLLSLSVVDKQIRTAAEKWEIDRIGAVERAILRIGSYEILIRMEIPAPVTISEAVEITKKYASEKAPPFINGVLDRIARDVRGPIERLPKPATGESE